MKKNLQKTSQILFLLIHLYTATTKVKTASVRVDKCGCDANTFDILYTYSVVDSKGYYEFLKDQIHYFHRKWVHQLINSTNSDKLYHVFVQNLKSRPLYTTVNDQKITIDKKKDYFHRYESLLGLKKDFMDKLRIFEFNDEDMIDLVNEYFNDDLSKDDNFGVLMTKLSDGQDPGKFDPFIYHYGKFIKDRFQITAVGDVFKIEKLRITKDDAFLLLNLGVYLKLQNDIKTKSFLQTQKWVFDALAYEVEVELKDNQKLLKKKFYLIYQLQFFKGGANLLQFKTKAYYLDSTKTKIGVDDLAKETILQANFLKKDMKERKDLFKKFPIELKFVQAYKYPGPHELQTSCVFAGASLRVAISFIVSSLMRDNFGTYYYCGEKSLMLDFDINQWGRDGKEWLSNYNKLKPNSNPYSPGESKKKKTTTEESIEEIPVDGKNTKSDEKVKKTEEEIEITPKTKTKTKTTTESEEPIIADEFDPDEIPEKKAKKTIPENQSNPENSDKENPSKSSEEEQELPLTKLILPTLKPPFEFENSPDFSETIQLPLEEEPITKETVLDYNCKTFLESISGESYLYPENLSKNIFFINNLSFLSIQCEEEIEENGNSSGSINLYDSPILKLIFTMNETRYCFEIDGDTVLYNSTYFVCFNKLKDGEIDFILKKSDPLLALYKRIYSPVLEGIYQTLLTLNDMKKSYIVAGDIWDFLFEPFFGDLKFEEFRGDLLKEISPFKLSFSLQTKKVERNMINEKGFIYWLSFEEFTEMKILVRIINANEDFLKLSINVGENYFELFIPKMFYLDHEEMEIVNTHSPVILKEEFYLQNNYLGLIAKFFAKFVDSEKTLPEITEKGGYSFDVEKNMPEFLQNYFKVNYSDFTLLFSSMSYMLSNMTYGEENKKLYDLYVGNINEDLIEFLNSEEQNNEMIKNFENYFYCERQTSLDFSELPKDEEEDEEDGAIKESLFTPRKTTEFSNFVNILIESSEHEKWIYITEKNEKSHFHDLEGILKNDKINLTQKLDDSEDNLLQTKFLQKLYYYLRTKSDTLGENKFTLLFGNREIKRFMLFEAWGYEMNHIKVFHINLFSLYFNTQFIIQNSTFSFDLERLFGLITMTSNHFKDIVLSMEDFEMHTFDFTVEKIKEEIDKLVEGKNICYFEVTDPEPEVIENEEDDDEKNILTYFIAKSHSDSQNCDVNEGNLVKDFKLAIVVRKKIFKNKKAGYIMKIYDNKIKEGIKNVLSTEYEFYRHSPYNFRPIFRNYVKGVIEHFVTGKFDFSVTPPRGKPKSTRKMKERPNPFKTPEEDLQKNFEKLSIIKSSKESQNFDEDLDLLNECVAKSRNKLNISVDEKEELNNLDDEAIEKEFNEFMKNISKDNTADQFLNEISKIMEKGVGQQDPNFLNSFDDGNFDNFSKNLLYQFVNKDVIYEPLKEAKKKIEELVQNKKNDKNLKVNNEKLKLINDIITLLEIENSNDKIKEEVICKFEELNDKGGLPEEIVKNCMKENPDLENFQKFTNGKACRIF